MDIFAVAFFILLGTAMIAFVVSPTTARGLDTFGAGFVPYRSAGWPHGVQEEDPVHWSDRKRSRAASAPQAPTSARIRVACDQTACQRPCRSS